MTAAKQKEQTMELMPREDEQRPTDLAERREQLPAAPGEHSSSSLMTIIDRIAERPDIDLDRVERLFGMHEQMVKRQQEQAFNEAMAKAQCEIQSVVVNKKNDHLTSKYADLSAIHAHAKPIWTKHGLSVITKTRPSDVNGCMTVFGEVRHAGGHKEPFENDWPLDIAGSQGKTNKTAIQAMGSTISYARRYTELMIFDIAIQGEDKDGNGQAQELSSKAADWVAAVQECTTMPELEKKYKEAFDDLDGDGFGRNQLIKATNIKKKELKNAK